MFPAALRLSERYLLQVQKVLEKLFAVLGQDGFGMELYAMNWKLGVHQPHDFTFGSFGGDFQAGRQAFAFDDE